MFITKRKRTASEASINNESDSQPMEKIPKEVLIVAQEMKIIKALASNDSVKRNRQVRKLRKWLQLRARSSYPITEGDFMRIWKGLYYNMWMSDKPLVQEELAEQLAQLLQCFDENVNYSIEFFTAFIKTMIEEWFGIDQWRIDKFLMFIRRMLRSMLNVLKGNGWSEVAVRYFNKQMVKTVLSDDMRARGLTMHYLDIFLEELAKSSQGKISTDQVNLFLLPFVTYMGNQNDAKLIAQCRSRVLYHLLYQSQLGREYLDKYNAWKEMGFPTESIDDLEKEEITPDATDENIEDNNTVALDPRAGGVDVYMPELPVDPNCVINELERLLHTQDYNIKRRKALRKLITVFETYKQGEFPLGVKKIQRPAPFSMRKEIDSKVEELDKLENDVYGIGRKLKQLNKRKRRKLLKSLNFTEVDESSYDKTFEKVFLTPIKSMKRKKNVRCNFMNNWKEEIIEETTTLKNSSNCDAETNIVTNVNNGTEQEKVVLKIVKDTTQQKPKLLNGDGAISKKKSKWDKPLSDGEIEFFIPSRKNRLNEVNREFVINPLAGKNAKTKTKLKDIPSTPTNSSKRVKIVLQHNTSQKPSDYIKQIKSSPQLPYDADKKPGKGLLKPNAMPSPINPFYKKKIGLKLLSDSP